MLRPKSAVRKATNQSTAAPTTRRAAPVAKESTSKNKAYATTTQQRSNTKGRASRSKLDASPTKQPASVIETNPKTKSERELWQTQKNALKEKFGEQGWQPRKRLSPDTLDGIRALHVSDPNAYTTPVLAAHFQVTPEAIRRILKSKWRPNTEEIDDRKDRWERRGERKWKAMAEQGTRPPAKWRAKGIKTPHAEQKRAARRQDGRYVRWEDDTLEGAGSSLAQRIR
ncbi:hypothetical protein BDY17DRAFT_257482 [Neohortaea acidophila]|uniref:Required for respiratory growth protein 9, mitochondrial n=1 Tax=Neohortaea acidophila TaxID=245834 RepID=A0A6A6PHR3_9PEZI|nr:uncharacterized protein BDY17DRAFT_257482 [Neohortaea acidophila]KAF2479271.1 hypothetical protein BDY17DRAFT_257482 [Neohortaea acidophila]